jgi:hypothetical protein
MSLLKQESACIKQKKDQEKKEDDIQKAIFDLEHAEENKVQELVCTMIAYKHIEGSQDSPYLLKDENADVHLLYSINHDITSFLKKTFGSIAKCHYQQYARRRSPYTVKAERKINVKVQGDNKVFYIYGSCLTKDNLGTICRFSWNGTYVSH